MAIPEDGEHEQPDGVGREFPIKDADPRYEGRKSEQGRPRQNPVKPTGDRVSRVSAIELTHREKVHGGHQHPDPARTVQRADAKITVAMDPEGQKGGEEGWTEKQASFFRQGFHAHLGVDDSGDQNGERDEKTRQRAGRRDIEEGPSMRDDPANSDHGSEGAEWRDTREKKWQRGRNAVRPARPVMSELMRAEDREEGRRVGESFAQPPNRASGVDAKKAPFPEPAAGQSSGQERGQKKDSVNPRSGPDTARPSAWERGILGTGKGLHGGHEEEYKLGQ